MHAWTVDRVAALLPRYARDLAGVPVVPIVQGWDNAAFRVGDKALRFPLRDDVVPHLLRGVRMGRPPPVRAE